MTVRRVLAAAAAASVVFSLAGCGGDDDTAADKSSASSSASDSAEPTDATSDEGGSGEEMSADEFAGLLRDALDKATTAHVTMDLGGATGTAEGDADYTKTPPEIAMTMTMDQLGGDVEVRLVAGTMYMKSASFGDKWISISLDDPNSPLGALGDQLDVTKALESFAAAVTSATDNGSEDVDGDTLEHYTATVDTAKLLQSMPDLGAGGASLPDTMTQEWWFDEDGLIRKFSTEFGETATTVSLSDWGKDVSIEAPPSDEVTTMPGGSGGS